MKVIIIGGVAGGATTAARIRRKDESTEIILLEKGEYISYANCGLPYYIGGVIAERERLFVQTPEVFGQRFNIDVRVNNEVLSIDKENKKVSIKRKSGEIYEENYDKLLISTGALPVRPPLEGIDNSGIFTLRNVTDTDQIKNYIEQKEVKRAVIIGAGFIGLEMAENIHAKGIDVSIVEMANQVMNPIDFSMASFVHEHLQDKGVNLYLKEAVTSFTRDEKGELTIHLASGKTIVADLVLLSIGVRPNTTLAKEAGLTIGKAGGIYVNSNLQTSNSDIYAIGDAIEYPHPITKQPWLNYLAGPANRQGRVVADNILGAKIAYEGSIGTSIAKVFDLTVASTGLPAKKLQSEEIAYKSVTTHGSSHAGYYPNALPLTIKLTFCPTTGKLYGAQVVGYDGVDKRIDQLAQIIKHHGTIYDIIELEHAYAPPFSSAKDPIAIAGYTAQNIIDDSVKVINWRELHANIHDYLLLDIRTKDEHTTGGLPNAINIPLDELRERINEVPKDKKVVLFCAVGLRGYLAYRLLNGRGYDNVYNLDGGLKVYHAATAPIKNKEQAPKQEVKTNATNMNPNTRTIKVDACGLQCPGPIMRLKNTIDEMAVGEQVEITSTDAAFPRDAAAWCGSTGHKVINSTSNKGKYTVNIVKQDQKVLPATQNVSAKGKTFILFSDDLDKALATFILANGAAATGQKVTIFFTFWGLNAIKKEHKPKVEKDFLGKMFSFMLPKSSKQLKLSKMNMGGMGSKMMRYIMKSKNIDSLESLRRQALFNGVEFIACQMSMDVMGVAKEELLPEVSIGGVATYMERADKANGNLFI